MLFFCEMFSELRNFSFFRWTFSFKNWYNRESIVVWSVEVFSCQLGSNICWYLTIILLLKLHLVSTGWTAAAGEIVSWYDWWPQQHMFFTGWKDWFYFSITTPDFVFEAWCCHCVMVYQIQTSFCAKLSFKVYLKLIRDKLWNIFFAAEKQKTFHCAATRESFRRQTFNNCEHILCNNKQ